MHKYIITILLLAILDITLFNYLSDISQNKNTLEYSFINDVFVIQTKDIKVLDINNIYFDDYFELLSLNNHSYRIKNDESNIYVEIDNKEYSFNYYLIKPEIIEKVVYVDREINNTNNDLNTNQNSKQDYYEEYDYFYVNSDYFSFPLETDLDKIRNILSSNINTTYQTSIDYSRLNVSQIGRYSVFYLAENKKIEIIVEIL